MSSVDWCKLYERLTIRFEEKLSTRLSSKTNNIHDAKNEVFRLGFISKSTVLCGYVHIYQINF